MTLTITPALFFDILGMMAVGILGGTAIYAVVLRKNAAGGTLGLLVIALAAAILINCAPFAPAPRRDDGSEERCIGLIALACNHDLRCGLGGGVTDPTTCIEQFSGDCRGATGLTQAEADSCALAMLRQPCPGDFPEECLDIIGEAELAPQPKVHSL